MNKILSRTKKLTELNFDLLAIQSLVKRLKTNLDFNQRKKSPYSDEEIIKTVNKTRNQIWREKYEKKIKALS